MAPVSTGSVEEYVVAFAEGGSAAVLDQPHFEEGEGEVERMVKSEAYTCTVQHSCNWYSVCSHRDLPPLPTSAPVRQAAPCFLHPASLSWILQSLMVRGCNQVARTLCGVL